VTVSRIIFDFPLTRRKAHPGFTRGGPYRKKAKRSDVRGSEGHHRALALTLRPVQVGVHPRIGVHAQARSLGRVLQVGRDRVRSRPPVRAELGFLGVPVVADLAERVSRPCKRSLFALVRSGRGRQHPVDGFKRTQKELLDHGAVANGCSRVAVGRCHRRVLTRLPSLNDLLHIGHAVAHVAGMSQGESALGCEVVRRHGVVAHRADHRHIATQGHRAIERLRHEEVARRNVAASADLHGVPLEGTEQSATAAKRPGGIDLDLIDRAELIGEVEEISDADRAILAAVQTKDLAIVGAHQRLVFIGRDHHAVGQGDVQIGGRDRVPRRDDLPCLGRVRELVKGLREAVPCAGLVDCDGIGRFDEVSHGRFLAPLGRVG